ncbi:hypothetical protein G6F63_015991 [Rhizopus arrhizus]|nr:hypothetical protein G6F63_015991 [Rhizopus arrhizus]
MLTLGENARHASRAMMRANSAAKNKALLAMADALAASHDELKAANEQDVAAARANGLEPALLDRLTLCAYRSVSSASFTNHAPTSRSTLPRSA